MSLKLFDLTGRRALITGSSQGIGLALARGLAEAGAAVVLNGRDRAKLEAAAARLKADGLAVDIAAFDVTDSAAVDAGVARIEAELGPVGILCNNAGVNLRGALHEMPDETWHTVIATNLHSAFYCARAVAKGMVARGQGKIINTCSVMSMLGRATTGPYTATKGAIGMLTKAMCADWAKHGIQCNGIAPGYFSTELTAPLRANPEFNDWLCKRTPAGRWGELPELVGAAVFLASDASSYVNGHLLYVDGGLTSVV
ncbi:gluconate 5-dehydrogenase [Siccirubricoccus deserti]|uniref:SDR family oxidoreductase n=1 Tax=Siccirubricoccus deserti TaxID=2013562 RepID=A0A9X0R1G2_9PROT|nr:SDR family oxidoreductase [Siccirubricoccus deserti]MBC4017795.1 SDR family oxidoreductase [Siccirubricoccus deserti]GGC61366.1 gluconate 5-dehydrogenase [Siccirubricoccus deserti]